MAAAAIAAMNDAEVQKLLDGAGSDLKFAFAKEKVEDSIQAMFYWAGITNIRQFSMLASDPEDLRETLKESFGLDKAAGLAERVKISKILVVWDACRTRSKKEAEMAGEAECRHQPKALGGTDYSAMRAAFEAKWWPLGDKEIPAKSYLERRLEQVEQEEPRAEPLTEVIHREEEDPDILKTVWDGSGALRVTKAAARVELPKNPEELRARVTLLGVAWMMIGYAHTNRAWLQGITPQLWQDYLKYLLGEFVWGLVGRDAQGHTVATPSWLQVLAYEHAVRKHAWKLVALAGRRFSDALQEAWKDPVVKERNFTTPLALSALAPGAGLGSGGGRRAGSGTDLGAGSSRKDTNGNAGNKTKKKGGKKGKGKGGGMDVKSNTPAGKPICFRYNRQGGCSMGNKCKFEHVCGACFGRHPMFQCPGPAGAMASNPEATS